MEERPASRPTPDSIDQDQADQDQADPNSAEQLDSTALGEERGDGLPGVNTINDRGPMSSEDPALLMGGSETQDEIHTREWRERPEADAEAASSDTAGVRLIESEASAPTLVDDESTAISDAKTTK